jgi:hypothetical protein
VEMRTQAGVVSRGALVVAVLVAVLVLVLSLLVLVGVPRWVPGSADCAATVGGRTVEVSADDAEAAASVAARAVRVRQPEAGAAAAIASRLGLDARDAMVLASALTGRAPHALSCAHGGSDQQERDRLDSVGLTARAARVRSVLDSAFGAQRTGGFAPGGVTTGHMPGSAHYEGRAVDVFFRPIAKRNKVRGWALAQYAVAHAERLAIETVIFDGRIWTARRGFQGWRSYEPDTTGRSPRVAAVLEHRDHVHVDVAD